MTVSFTVRRDSGICLNPFEIVEDYDEEADVGWAIGRNGRTYAVINRFSDANLKRQTRELWEKKVVPCWLMMWQRL